MSEVSLRQRTFYRRLRILQRASTQLFIHDLNLQHHKVKFRAELSELLGEEQLVFANKTCSSKSTLPFYFVDLCPQKKGSEADKALDFLVMFCPPL